MKIITITCAYCGMTKDIPLKEYNRQTKLGRTTWFCSISHAAKWSNEPRKLPPIVKNCLYCGKSFESPSGYHEHNYCSRRCASAGTAHYESRRLGSILGGKNSDHSPNTAARILKTREAYKYESVDKFLNIHNINHEFEKHLDGKIFDLCLPDKHLCIEFDGPEHNLPKQQLIDKQKDEIAKKHGFKIIRVKCDRNEILKSDVLSGLI